MRPSLKILYFYLLEYCYKIQILLEQGTLLVFPGNGHHEHTYVWCLLHEHCHSEEAIIVQGTTCTAVCAGPVWESWASFPSHQETLLFYVWKGWVQWHGLSNARVQRWAWTPSKQLTAMFSEGPTYDLCHSLEKPAFPCPQVFAQVVQSDSHR